MYNVQYLDSRTGRNRDREEEEQKKEREKELEYIKTLVQKILFILLIYNN